MDDSVYMILTLALQKDSEFLQVFNHYILKALESGEFKRLWQKYYRYLYIREQFEMLEPQPIGYSNVMFCYCCLGLGISLSLIQVIMEFIWKKLTKQQKWSKKPIIREEIVQRKRGGRGGTNQMDEVEIK